MTEQNDSNAKSVECRVPKATINRMLFITLLLFGVAGYFAYDTFLAKDDQGEAKYSMEKKAADYIFNLTGSIIMPLAGLAQLARVLITSKRKLVADQEGIALAGKAKVPWSQVDKLVTRGKGLLEVCYKKGNGQGVIKLDSFKLDNFNELVALIEAKTPGVDVGSS